MKHRSAKISACVVTYNRAAIVGTCLKALAFADEVIVVDKTSTDDTRQIVRALADRVFVVPWTPVVEDTRAFAVSQCRHDWVLLLDDDECLSVEAVRFITAELLAPQADAYAFPLRHYILGVHDERAYYWPEHHVRLFRQDAVTFRPRVHGGLRLNDAARLMQVPVESGAHIHHLSHASVTSWIARTNRYTQVAEREMAPLDGRTLVAFAHARIDHWAARSRGSDGTDYPAAVALLRAVYDIVDQLKAWEAANGLGRPEAFPALCAALEAQYAGQPRTWPRFREGWARLLSWVRRRLRGAAASNPARTATGCDLQAMP